MTTPATAGSSTTAAAWCQQVLQEVDGKPATVQLAILRHFVPCTRNKEQRAAIQLAIAEIALAAREATSTVPHPADKS